MNHIYMDFIQLSKYKMKKYLNILYDMNSFFPHEIFNSKNCHSDILMIKDEN